MRQPDDRMCVLTDTLQGVIRWRFSDYERLLKEELRILAAPSARAARAARTANSGAARGN